MSLRDFAYLQKPVRNRALFSTLAGRKPAASMIAT